MVDRIANIRGTRTPYARDGLWPVRGLSSTRSGPVGLLRDLQDLYLLASLVDVTWAMIKQVGSALHDQELLAVVAECDAETAVQLRWLQTRMEQAAPQALFAARRPGLNPVRRNSKGPTSTPVQLDAGPPASSPAPLLQDGAGSRNRVAAAGHR